MVKQCATCSVVRSDEGQEICTLSVWNFTALLPLPPQPHVPCPARPPTAEPCSPCCLASMPPDGWAAWAGLLGAFAPPPSLLPPPLPPPPWPPPHTTPPWILPSVQLQLQGRAATPLYESRRASCTGSSAGGGMGRELRAQPSALSRLVASQSSCKTAQSLAIDIY